VNTCISLRRLRELDPNDQGGQFDSLLSELLSSSEQERLEGVAGKAWEGTRVSHSALRDSDTALGSQEEDSGVVGSKHVSSQKGLS